MRVARRVALPIMALLLLVASPADLAVASPEDACRFAKFRAGGKYVGCLLKADSNFAKTSRGPADDLARTARIETCLAGFQKSFAGAESTFGAGCGVAGSLVSAATALGACRSAAQALVGTASSATSPPGASQSCESSELLAAAKYGECLLKAESVFAKSAGDATDVDRLAVSVAKCRTRVLNAFARAELVYPAQCPVPGSGVAVRDGLAECLAGIEATPTPTATPAPTPTPTPATTPTPPPTPAPTPTPGTCVLNCGGYACDTATGLCRTTCAAGSDCAVGFGCSAGVCRKVDGEFCAVGGDCLNGACCTGVCRNLATDPSNCGTCGLACTNANGTTACTAGACSPTCSEGFANCDGNVNDGCERSIRTNTDCAACGVGCSRTNASATCNTGTCRIATCTSGFADCDGVDSNGCELAHGSASNACATATDLGAYCADENYGCGAFNLSCCDASLFTFVRRSGRTSRWFRARANECSNAVACSGILRHLVTLVPPANTDYDLYVYSACGALLGSSTGAGSATETVEVTRNDSPSTSESFDYWVEVRFFAGSSCDDWDLTIRGRTIP